MSEPEKPLDPALIEEWRSLAERATGGPWRIDFENGSIYARVGTSFDSENQLIERVATMRATCVTDRWASDALLIAAAREAVPRLIAEVERLRRERDDKRELLAHAGLALGRAAELLDCTGECEEDSPCSPCLVNADVVAAIAAIREGR